MSIVSESETRPRCRLCYDELTPHNRCGDVCRTCRHEIPVPARITTEARPAPGRSEHWPPRGLVR